MATARVLNGNAWVKAGAGDVVGRATDQGVVAHGTTVAITNPLQWRDPSAVDRDADGSWVVTVPPFAGTNTPANDVQLRVRGSGWSEIWTSNDQSPQRQLLRSGINKTQGNYQQNQTCMTVSFMHSGTHCGIGGWSRDGVYRIRVNGRYVTQNRVAIGGNLSNKNVTIQFSQPAVRRVDFEILEGYFPYFVRCDPAGAIWLPRWERKPRILWIGDSYIFGSNSVARGCRDVAHLASEYLGCDDVIVDALGGTGYVKTNGAAATPAWDNYPTRVGNNVGTDKALPDLVIVNGSINDNAQTNTDVQTNAADLYDQLDTDLPGIPVAVVTYGTNSGVAASTASRITAVHAAAIAASNVIGHLDLNPDLTGTGNETGGTGTRALWLSSDNTHPNQAGHEHYAQRIADWLAPTVQALDLS